MKKLLAAWLCVLLLTGPVWAGFDFRDEFTTALDAGAVNGTAAEPGPWVRTVVDTESVVSIADGSLTMNADGTGTRDPIVNYATGIFRNVGTGLFCDVAVNTVLGSSQQLACGFSNSTTFGGTSVAGPIFAPSTSPSIVFYTNGTASPTVGTISALDNIAIFLRSNGHFDFVNNELVWISLVGSSETLYPLAILNPAANRVAVSVDYMRIPSTRWLPDPFVSDGFSASTSDGLGHAETTGLGSGGSGVAWVGGTGSNWVTSGGVVSNTPTLEAGLSFDGGFEAWESTTNLTNWTEALSGTSTVNRESSVKHGGTYSVRLDVDASNSTVSAKYDGNFPAGTWYKAIGWYAGDADSGLQSRFDFDYNKAVTLIPTTTWQSKYAVALTSGANGRLITVIRGSAASHSLYFDDISIYKILTPSTLRTFTWPSGTTPTADIIADVKLGANPSGTQAGMVLNLDSLSNPLNFILVYYDGTNLKVDEVVNGVYTNKISTAYTWATGTIIRVIRDGTELRLYSWNGTAWAQVGTTQTMTANVNTNHGLFATDPTCSLDNYVVYARGTSGEYAVLDTLNTVPATADSYALTLGPTFVGKVRGVLDAGGVYGGVKVEDGADAELSHLSLGRSFDFAVRSYEDLVSSNSLVYCADDDDCRVYMETGTTLTGETNALVKTPSGDGTNSLTGTIALSRDPFVSLVGGDFRLRRGAQAIDAATADATWTSDTRGRAVPQGAGADAGAYESSKGTVLLDDDFVKFYKP